MEKKFKSGEYANYKDFLRKYTEKNYAVYDEYRKQIVSSVGSMSNEAIEKRTGELYTYDFPMFVESMI